MNSNTLALFECIHVIFPDAVRSELYMNYKTQ